MSIQVSYEFSDDELDKPLTLRTEQTDGIRISDGAVLPTAWVHLLSPQEGTSYRPKKAVRRSLPKQWPGN